VGIRFVLPHIDPGDHLDVYPVVPASSDAHGPAQSCKPAEAGPVEAEPSKAAWTAYDGSRLRLEDIRAGSRGSSRGFWRPCEYLQRRETKPCHHLKKSKQNATAVPLAVVQHPADG
jgi:hypothetical protein